MIPPTRAPPPHRPLASAAGSPDGGCPDRVLGHARSIPQRIEPAESDPGRTAAEQAASLDQRNADFLAVTLPQGAAQLPDAVDKTERSLRAFDAFPQTHHVECVARYRRG